MRLVGKVLQAVVCTLFRLNGRVYGEGDVSPVREALGAWKHFERALYGDGYYGEAELAGEYECASFEGTHIAGEGAGSFGKHYDRHAVREYALGVLHGGAGGRGRGVVDVYMFGYLAGIAHKGYGAEAAFHHPAEVVVEIAVDAEDVVGALVIGHEDVAAAGRDVLAPVYRDTYEGERAEYPGPYLGGVVAPPISAAEHASGKCKHYRKQGGCYHERHHYQKLVNTVKDEHGGR